jgi:hypothetical protein
VRLEAEDTISQSFEALLFNVSQYVEVSCRFGHSLICRQEVFAVHPEAGGDHAVARLALGNLILVMRKHVVDAAGVDVELWPQVLARHG